MWGDTDHIKKLKQGEPPPWPTDFPDPKKAKKQEQQQQRADRAAQKAADAEARAIARWSQMPPAKPAKQPPAKRPSAADIANLKAEAWEAKQQQKAMKDAWRAQKELLEAEKAAAKLAQWQAAEDLRLQRETAGLGKAAKQRDLAQPTSEASDYAYAPSTGGCATTTFLLLLLVVLIAILLLCVCDCLV